MVSGVPPRFSWVASFLYLAVILAHGYYWWMGLCGDEVTPTRSIALVGLLASLLIAEPYATRPHLLQRSRWMPMAFLAVRIVLYEGVATLDCAGFSKFMYLLVPFQAYFSLGKRAGYALALAYLGILVVRFSAQDSLWYLRDAYVSVLLIFVVGVTFVVVMARALQDKEVSRARAQQLLEDLERSHAELRASAAQVAELAAADERNRLARDIHDSLGHHLTAISVQLAKAQAYRARSPDEADRAVQEASHSAQAALTDVRQSVSALRTTGQAFALRAALTELVARADDEHFAIDLQVTGDEAGFTQPALMALYRAAQEGLTNVYRHAAGARHVTLHVTMTDDGARLSLHDDGPGFDQTLLDALPPNRRDRFGLQGARERVELAGGWMRIESSAAPDQPGCGAHSEHPGQGTRLLIWVPRQLPAVQAIPGSPHMSAVRVLVVDDQRLIRDGIASLLAIQDGVEVVGTAADGRDAIEQALALRPDVVLMDIRMPVVDGVTATREIRQHLPTCRVLMLTTFDDQEYAVEALRAGASGYLLKDVPASDLAQAVRLAHAGIYQFDPVVAGRLIAASEPREHTPSAPLATHGQPLVDALTGRERAVLRLLATGATNREIAAQLVVSEGTVKNHVSSILGRLGLRDRTQAALYARDHGLL